MHYQQLIITEPVSNFRSLARQGIQGRWGDAFVKGLLYALVVTLPLMIIYSLGGIFSFPDYGGMYESYLQAFSNPDALNNIDSFSVQDSVAYINRVNTASAISSIYTLLVSGALMLGITQVYLRYRRKQEAPTELVFSGFSNFSRALALYILMTIFTVLWTLLFIIPGIIAAYRYRLAFYILAENPNVGPLEAINISKGLMRGNKWKLFCLDISFIGWAILDFFAIGILSAPLSMLLVANGDQGIGVPLLYAVILTIISSVGLAWLQMYWGTSNAAFYERASGLLKYHDEVQTNIPPIQYS